MKLQTILEYLNIKYLSPKYIKNIGFINFFYYLIMAGIFLILGRKANTDKYFFLIHKNSQILLKYNLGDILTYLEIFAFEEYLDFLKQIDKRKNYNILDLGANAGLFYLYMNESNIKISSYIGVEPIDSNLKSLYFNSYPYSSQVINKAVWKHSKGVKFSSSEISNANSVSSSGDIKVPSITIKELIETMNNSYPSILKMDIEGAEYEVIEEDKDLFNYFEYLVIEFHNVKKQEDLEKFVQKNFINFKFEVYKKSSELFVVILKSTHHQQ